MERVDRMGATAREDFLEDRVELWCDRLRAEGVEVGRAEGLEAGLAKERQLLVRQAELRFGSAASRRLAALVSGVDDAARLEEVGGWIVTCETADELLARVAGD